MPRSGLVNQRANARVLVLRGFNPNEPHTLTQSLPVASGTILSGQVISTVWTAAQGSYAWTLGATATVPYIALQDSADEDVQEAGKLTGLSCAGDFEIQTPFYTSGTYALNDLLTASTGANLGKVQAATGANQILGHVTRNPGAAVGTVSAPTSEFLITGSYTGGNGSATGPGAVFTPGTNSNVVAPELVITFATTYNGAVKA